MIKKLLSLFYACKKSKLTFEPKHIAFLRLGGIGDVLMTTPLVRCARKKYPKARITYIVGKWSASALQGNKDIDEVISFDDAIVYKKNILKLFRLTNNLSKKNIDLCFVLDKMWGWGMLAQRFAKFRIGFDRKGEGFANNISVPFDGTKHEIDYYLDLAKAVDIRCIDQQPKLAITTKTNKLQPLVIGIAPGGAINPGQSMLAKRWPLKHYEKLITTLLKENPKLNIPLFGGKNDKKICEKLATDKRIISYAGISLDKTAALMSQCKLVITHDSGPMHIASTTKTKLIALFGPTPAGRFAPKNAHVISSKVKGCPSYDLAGKYKDIDCMSSITPELVLKTAKTLL